MENGFGEADLAMALGWPAETLRDLEAGRRSADAAEVWQLAERLGVGPESLLPPELAGAVEFEAETRALIAAFEALPSARHRRILLAVAERLAEEESASPPAAADRS